MPRERSASLKEIRPPSRVVDPDDRVAKKFREAERLRNVPPERTLELGFDLMSFSRKLARAADRAKL